MQVSVVIVNYNTFDLTCACIQSVIDKTKGVSYEIILVDNASKERNPDFFLERFETVTLIKSDVNVGFAKGNNLGIAKAKGDSILLLNSDTILKNDAISICKKFLDTFNHVGAVSARLEYPDGTVQHNCQRFPSIRYKLFELLRLQKVLPKKRAGKMLMGYFFDYSEVAFPDWIWGTFFMFPKHLLELLPGCKLADDFFMYVEDVQWCKEFQRLGYSVAFEPVAVVTHYMGKSSGAKSELIEKNHKQFMAQYYRRFDRFVIGLLDRLLRK